MSWLIVKDGFENGVPMRTYAGKAFRGRWGYTCQREAATEFETRAEAEEIRKKKMHGKGWTRNKLTRTRSGRN